jgi:uncharacterized protein with PQ loop repeat
LGFGEEAAMASSWNPVGLEVLYQVLGWVAFFAWSFSFYPQVLLNYKRKRSVATIPPPFLVCLCRSMGWVRAMYRLILQCACLDLGPLSRALI